MLALFSLWPAVLLTTAGLLLQSLTAMPVDGVTANSREWPPRDAAWVGDAPHRFLDGQVMLVCGSHGVFSTSGNPPTALGADSSLDYQAVFTGELTLSPPLSKATRTFPLQAPIRMTERLQATGRRGVTEHFTTELTTLDFGPSAFPGSVRIREAAGRRSSGFVSIMRQRDSRYRIQASYEVWLELSLDGGRSWQAADSAVTMRLQALNRQPSSR